MSGHVRTAHLCMLRYTLSCFIGRDGEQLIFVSERDGNLELYQQGVGRASGGAGDGAPSSAHGPERLTNAVSMEVQPGHLTLGLCRGSPVLPAATGLSQRVAAHPRSMNMEACSATHRRRWLSAW